MKIGILTYHYVFNEGAIWQAYALCRTIRELFPQHECEIVDYRYHGEYATLRKYTPEEKVEIYEEVLSEYRGAISIIDDCTDTLFEHLSSQYDVVISGSDVVWQFDGRKPLFQRVVWGLEGQGCLRPDSSSFYRFLRDIKNWGVQFFSEVMHENSLRIPFPNAYWLDPDGEYKKCTFAVSVGSSDVLNVSPEMRMKMGRYLNAMDSISVRDKASLRLVESVAPEKSKDTRLTPDPTWLIHDSLFNVDELFDRHGISDSDRLAGVLFPPYRHFGERMNRWVLPMLRERGFKIVSVIDPNKDADFNLAGDILNPFQWWSVISRLDFFFTVRMHPTIAALKYETPFANVDITAMRNRSSFSKSNDMLESFGLQECCLYQRSSFSRSRLCKLIDRSLARAWDWEAVAVQRNEHQKTGMEALVSIVGE